MDLSEVVQGLLQDIVFKIVLAGTGNKYGKHDLKGLVQEGMRLIGMFNIVDYVAWLGPLDLQVWTGLWIQFWKSVCYLNLIR